MPKKKQEAAEVKSKAEIYTYIGNGDGDPEVTEFMGLQKFILGEPTEVTNETVLTKIANNPSFIKGEMGKVEMFERKQAKQKEVELTKQRLNQMQNAENRRNQKYK